jgi:DNA-binding MarR family transcriptional regulator
VNLDVKILCPRIAAVAEPARDEVDTLVDAWRRERPDLDLAPMEVLSRVSRLAHHLDRRRATAFSAHGLEAWEFDVLAALRRSGAPYQLTPGQLIRETLVTSGTMTNRVDRLAARDLVSRYDHPGDRRGVLVRLTDQGRETVDAALADLLDAERAMLSRLSDADRSQLVAALRQLLAGARPTAAERR